VIISLGGATLRLEPGARGRRRVFPVAVGRLTPTGQAGPLGTFRTGPDPRDREYYLPSRRLPAFHRGLPFLRLDLQRAGDATGGRPARPSRPYGIHGPVTPTLIWGQVSRGCVRMRPRDLRLLYRTAVRHPAMRVTFVRGQDRVDGRAVRPDPVGPQQARCPEASTGVRRLGRLAVGRAVHDRVCGGVDHWYALSMAGGTALSAGLSHGGALSLELYGIKAISAIAAGRHGLQHRIPQARHNRGDRYLRVVAPGPRRGGARFFPYTLTVSISGRASGR
jgi:hypothetical protein